MLLIQLSTFIIFSEKTTGDSFDDTENLVSCDLITSVHLVEKNFGETRERSRKLCSVYIEHKHFLYDVLWTFPNFEV